MAYGVTKVNPVATTTNYEVVGKDITFFTVDYINAVNGSAGPAGAQKAVLDTIMNRCTIIAAGPLVDTNTQQTFAVEGTFDGSTYVAADGTTGLTFVGALQDDVRNLGTVDGVDLSNATVTATKLGILTAAAVS